MRRGFETHEPPRMPVTGRKRRVAITDLHQAAPPGRSTGYGRAESFTTVDDIAEFLPGLERRRPRRGDGDALARLRVPPLTGGARAGGERPESCGGDGFVRGEGISDGGEDGADGAVGRDLGERDLPGDVCGEIGLVHGVSSRCGWTSTIGAVPFFSVPVRPLVRKQAPARARSGGRGPGLGRLVRHEATRNASGSSGESPPQRATPQHAPARPPTPAAAQQTRSLRLRRRSKRSKRGIAYKRLEVAKRRLVLGRAPGDDSGAVAEAAEDDGHGAQDQAGEALEEVEGEPGEIGAGGHEEQSRGAGADDVLDTGGGALAELGQQPGERRAGVGGRDVRAGVVVDPRAAREVVEGDDAGVKRMVVAGDDARGEVDEALAAEEPGQGFAGVDAAAVKVGLAGGEQAQPLGAGAVSRRSSMPGNASRNRAMAGGTMASTHTGPAVTRSGPVRPERAASAVASAVPNSRRMRRAA